MGPMKLDISTMGKILHLARRVVVVPKKKSCTGNHKSCRCHTGTYMYPIGTYKKIIKIINKNRINQFSCEGTITFGIISTLCYGHSTGVCIFPEASLLTSHARGNAPCTNAFKCSNDLVQYHVYCKNHVVFKFFG